VAFDVRTLRAALRRDAAARESAQFRGEPLWANLSQGGRFHLGRLVDWLARHRTDIYAVFADEDDLLVAIADAAEQLGDEDWTLEELLDRAVTDAIATWAVPVPLVGVRTPSSARALDEALVLAPSSAWRNDNVDSRDAQRQVERLVGAPVKIGSRYVHDVDGQLVDTRRTATLICMVRGTRGWCRRIAFETSRFLVAGWTLFAPPEAELHTPMWPQVTEWQPQPQLQVQEAMHRVQAAGTSAEHRGMTVLHGPDDAAFWSWPDSEVIGRVLRAVRAASRSRAAAALITAGWDLYLAARSPSDAPWIERLVHIMHAREALCEDPDGDRDLVKARFRAVCNHLAIAEVLKPRGWGAGELQVMSGELQRLRNLAIHSSDVSRLRLGYAPVRDRIKLESPRVAEIYVREAASPAYHVMREICVRLWIDADGRDYDEAAFEDAFR
jgi:hypothetical protein